MLKYGIILHVVMQCNTGFFRLEGYRGAQNDTLVRGLASHQCGQGSILAWCHKLVEFVVGTPACSDEFSPGSPFSFLLKNQ